MNFFGRYILIRRATTLADTSSDTSSEVPSSDASASSPSGSSSDSPEPRPDSQFCGEALASNPVARDIGDCRTGSYEQSGT